MEIGVFEIVLPIIILVVVFNVLFKNKVWFIGNFFIGGLILIGLSKMDFLGFQGQIGIVASFLIFLCYIFLNIAIFLILLFKNKTKIYFIFPTAAFLIILFLLFFILAPDIRMDFKLGFVVRLFLSVFPLLIITYYIKFSKLNNGYNEHESFEENDEL